MTIDVERLAEALADEYSGERTYVLDDCGDEPGGCFGHPTPMSERREEATRIIARLAALPKEVA